MREGWHKSSVVEVRARQKMIGDLHQKGHTLKEIAWWCGMSEKCVQWYLYGRGKPKKSRKSSGASSSCKGNRFKYVSLCNAHSIVDYRPDDVNYIRELKGGKIMYFPKILGVKSTMQEAKKLVRQLNNCEALRRNQNEVSHK